MPDENIVVKWVWRGRGQSKKKSLFYGSCLLYPLHNFQLLLDLQIQEQLEVMKRIKETTPVKKTLFFTLTSAPPDPLHHDIFIRHRASRWKLLRRQEK